MTCVGQKTQILFMCPIIFFALNDGKDLIFYYNPMHFWDKLPHEKIKDYVWENLKKECAVFKNFDPDGETKSQFLENQKPHPVFFSETPKIGNHYSFLGNRVVSHHGNYYFLGDLGGCSKIKTQDLDIGAVNHLLHIAVRTKTPNYIKGISKNPTNLA
jgi:hypothetical protein